MKQKTTLMDRYPPSKPCTCEVCRGYCVRPGWWTVEQADWAIASGYARRMMLEVSPERTFNVLSPAFKGCEAAYAMQDFAAKGCTFLVDERCELYGTGVQPLECRFCHHDRPGQGARCHADLEKDWNTLVGQALVGRWIVLIGATRPGITLPVLLNSLNRSKPRLR